ncbi:hypothetical protein NDU88_002859 [Pleurodeles waltl]|uniref:FAM194 C-terminal domain-containing protein n=1 Tax=Pleurodeles waltl TaxID=8319 RepID=A0AAV7NHL2_PLEWA|nr:hypothetical protein NDU88_002859 [Pleurodeles waltl]
MNLDPSGGYYFNKNGTRLTRWVWKGSGSHIHAPPFQPIILKVNPRIEIRIASQDQIQLTFSTKRSGLKLNLGARLKLKDPQEALEVRMSEEQQLLHQKSLLIQNLLARIKYEVRRSKSYNLEKHSSGNLTNEGLPVKPQASKVKPSSSVGQSKSAPEQHHGKQSPQGALGKATKTRDSIIRLKSKDQLDPQQSKMKVKEQLGSARRASTATSTGKPAAKSQSSNATK